MRSVCAACRRQLPATSSLQHSHIEPRQYAICTMSLVLNNSQVYGMHSAPLDSKSCVYKACINESMD